ncbi:MAG: hypothetical protein SAJ12_24085 [Jaaginema sp. PMC 1079.18]|nr:hypothetical protein [Jaaginema sp. PMC 1080.18]MEC4854073.1 hypothetical protein [Jaaginema sp. PMC 1079.18]MEC4868402.1 hypothetical protein [Jaaginema sp. PMC 1078.18]
MIEVLPSLHVRLTSRNALPRPKNYIKVALEGQGLKPIVFGHQPSPQNPLPREMGF